MLIVPLRSEGVRQTIPLAVIVLIAINTLVFLLQYNDAGKEAAAHAFYRQSVLYQIEPDLYQRWLQEHPAARPVNDATQLALLRGIGSGPLSKTEREFLAVALQYDGLFQDALDAGRLLPQATGQQPQWRSDRTQYLALRHQGLVGFGAFVPREHRPHTFVTSMFLHADPMHLIGNMVFLWLAGALLEALIGVWRFCAMYLATGLVSCALSWALSPHSAIPELGASGAISGVMGALATTYGARMIPCLFNIGLYAWRGHMQGYWLAGVWVAWEAVQWMFMASNVNRAAHIGGLLAGAVAGMVFGRRQEVAQMTSGTAVDVPRQLRERARRQAADLQFESAARSMLSVVTRTQQADDWALLWAYGRHVLNTPTGEEVRRAILTANPQRPDVRQALLALQAQVRNRKS